MMHSSPKMAVVSPNGLMVLGLKQLLQSFMPAILVDVFYTADDLLAVSYEDYIHFFVETNILLTARPFFEERKRRTIVLTTSDAHAAQLAGFNCLNICQPEKQLVRAILQLQQRGHADGRNMPPQQADSAKTLTRREIDVLALVSKGLINKEIADRLGIGLTTVITHRRNITAKLGIRSVSGLTIYAVLNGYVSMSDI